MKIIILAAGCATRLRPLTDDTPKCLLPAGSMSLLERIIRNFLFHGLGDFIIVTGFQREKIEQAVAGTFPRLAPVFVYNDEFAGTNNAYSLWCGLRRMQDEECMITDSDILFDERLLEPLLGPTGQASLLVRMAGSLGSEEVKVVTDTGGRIIRIGKDTGGGGAGESIGIARFPAEAARCLRSILTRRIMEGDGRNEWYESAFQEYIDRIGPVKAIDTGGLPCMEIDTPEDLQTAAREVVPLLRNGR